MKFRPGRILFEIEGITKEEAQVAFKTAHVLNGMALFASISVLSFRVWRLRRIATEGAFVAASVGEEAVPGRALVAGGVG